MEPWHSQDRHLVRLDWGPMAAEALTTYAVAAGSPVCAVVVDVLSFTTCVSVAVDAGTRVHPYRWRDDSAQAFAKALGATLAEPRSETRDTGGVSLSPGSIRAAGAIGDLVLPSPNGSTISAVLVEAGAEVVAASLRNRSAVGHWLVDWLESSRGSADSPPWSSSRRANAGRTGRCGPPSRTSGAPEPSWRPSPPGSSTAPGRCC